MEKSSVCRFSLNPDDTRRPETSGHKADLESGDNRNSRNADVEHKSTTELNPFPRIIMRFSNYDSNQLKFKTEIRSLDEYSSGWNVLQPSMTSKTF